MKKEALEDINSGCFNAFNPDDELWIIGGHTFLASSTGTASGAGATDHDADAVYDWAELDEAAN